MGMYFPFFHLGCYEKCRLCEGDVLALRETERESDGGTIVGEERHPRWRELLWRWSGRVGRLNGVVGEERNGLDRK